MIAFPLSSIRRCLNRGLRLLSRTRKDRKHGFSTEQTKGFTLLEILVATSVLTMMVVVLASALSQALGIWGKSENKGELRENARAAISVISSELRQAVLPFGGQQRLGLVINPPEVSEDFLNHDTIFFQAPIATDRSKGDMAIVGYFVRKDGDGVPKLCRLFVNPGEADYHIAEANLTWLDDALLDRKALADEANYLPGLFLENVAGMWIKAYAAGSNVPSNTFDTGTTKALPSRVEISLVLIDSQAAARIKSGQIDLKGSASYSTPDLYVDALEDALKPHVEVVTVSVPFGF